MYLKSVYNVTNLRMKKLASLMDFARDVVSHAILVMVYVCVYSIKMMYTNWIWLTCILQRFETQRYGCLVRTWLIINTDSFDVTFQIDTSFFSRLAFAIASITNTRSSLSTSLIKRTIEMVDNMDLDEDVNRSIIHFVELFDGSVLLVKNNTHHLFQRFPTKCNKTEKKPNVYNRIIATMGDGYDQVDITTLIWKYGSSLTKENCIIGKDLIMCGILMGDILPTYGHIAIYTSLQVVDKPVKLTDLQTLETHIINNGFPIII